MKTTFKQIRVNFWEMLKEVNPELYKQGKRSKPQNEQVTDIRVSFVDYVDSLHRNGEITDKQANSITLQHIGTITKTNKIIKTPKN